MGTNFLVHLRAIIEDNAQHHGSRAFISDGTLTVTFGELLHHVNVIGAALSQHGIARHDVVTIIAENNIQTVLLILGVICNGSIAMPIGRKSMDREVDNLTRHADSKLIITERNFTLSNNVIQLKPSVLLREEQSTAFTPYIETADGALLLYTSGTTGMPKGILLTHLNLSTGVKSIIKSQSLDSRHVRLCLLPVYHSFGLISDILTMMFARGKVVIAPELDLENIEDTGRLIFDMKVNSFSAVPLIYEIMNEYPLELKGSDLRFCISGGAKIKRLVAETFMRNNNCVILQGYGLTETSCYSTVNPIAHNKLDSVGKPIACNTITVIDEKGQALPPHQIGEIIITGGNVMKNGYYKNNVIEAYHNNDNESFRSGDLGYVDEEGYVYIVGRKKNMVIRGGDKIYLEDLDFALSKMEEISEVATLKLDVANEELIYCFVNTRHKSLPKQKIIAHLEKEVGPSRMPDEILFIEKIPRTHTKKIKYKELSDLAKREILRVQSL